jgi:hypothetical protein
MIFDKLLNASQKHSVSLEARAVLGAKLRAESENLTLDPALAPLVDGVVAAMGFSEEQLTSLADHQRRAVAGIIRSFFRPQTCSSSRIESRGGGTKTLASCKARVEHRWRSYPSFNR